MLRGLYERTLALSARPDAVWWLAVIAFAEASFFPIPPDLLLVPMVLAQRERAWRLAAICTLASVAGGALGYLIGYALFDLVAGPLLRFYGYSARFESMRVLYDQYGLWLILIKGLTPIPYKIVTIACGAFAYSFPVFMLASLATRGARFFLLAYLLRRFGPSVQEFVENRLTLVTSVAAAGIVGGFLILRLL